MELRNEHARLGPPSLVRVCLSTFGRDFLKLGWLKAANTALGFSGPLLLKVVVDAVQDASEGEGANMCGTGCLFTKLPSPHVRQVLKHVEYIGADDPPYQRSEGNKRTRTEIPRKAHTFSLSGSRDESSRGPRQRRRRRRY